MGDPCANLLSPADQTRCPSCAAALRPGAPWCSLCYADLRPAGPEPLAAPPTVEYGLVEPDPLAVRAAGLGWPETSRAASTGPAVLALPLHAAPATLAPQTRWPCTACGASTLLSESVCAGCGTGFLAELRESEGPLLELPGVGDLTVLSRGQRLGLAAGVVLVVIALTAVVSLFSS